MIDSRRSQDPIWNTDPGRCGLSSSANSKGRELTAELQKYLLVLGPIPQRCFETLADLGLSDLEIGQYFKMPCDLVTELRVIWNIDGSV